MRVQRPRTRVLSASAAHSQRGWALLTLTWLAWLALQALILAAPPAGQKGPTSTSPAPAAPTSVWDAARRPIEGWGTAAPAAAARTAPEPATAPAPTTAAAPAPKPKAPKRVAAIVPAAAKVVPAAARKVQRPPALLDWREGAPPDNASASAAPAAEAVAAHSAADVTAERVRAVAPTPPPAAPPTPSPVASNPPSKQAIIEKKPAPTGLERLSDDWPAWAKVSMQYRGRVESSRGLVSRADYDGYYLNRLRFGVTFDAHPWVQAVFQAQDSQALEYAVKPAPRNMTNTLDLRLGYVAVGTVKGGPLAVRVGRQDMAFGEGRLIASPDWGNTNRAFDAIRTTTTGPGYKVDTFAGSPVDISQNGFDPRKPGEDFYGVYASFDKLIPGVIEPFALVRTTKRVAGELGGTGDGVLYTVGGRMAGRFKAGVDYAIDIVAQRGDIAGDPVTAWATHVAFIRTMNQTPWKPRVVFEYNFASGDRNPKDGRRETFDQLYASNHARYGLADAIGWRNMHHAGMTVELTPVKPLKITTGVHRFFLASLGDGLYGAGGSRTVFVKNATSRDVGWEADIAMAYTVSKELSLGAGLGTLFAGPYLEQAGAPSTFVTPYVLWSTKF